MVATGDIGWRLSEVIHHDSTVSWLSLDTFNGTRTDPIRLSMSANGVAEKGSEARYQASVVLEVISDNFDVRNVTIAVAANVVASIVANASTWGAVPMGASCNATRTPDQIVVQLGEERDVIFTACDVDSLPVAQELPSSVDRRSFSATLNRVADDGQGEAGTSMPVEAIAGSLYKSSIVVPERIGLHLLTIELDGVQLPRRLPILVTCPPPLVPVNGNRSCGCPPGNELAQGELYSCTACAAGAFQPWPSSRPCSPCPPGSFAAAEGSVACIPCASNSYQSRYGQDRCQICPFPTSTNGKTGMGECSSCIDGKYNIDPRFPADSRTCRPCPESAICIDNTTLSNLELKPGHWRLSSMTTDIHACYPYVGSLGNSSCLGGRNASAYCAPGHYGPLCTLCQGSDGLGITERGQDWLLGRHYRKSLGFCQECPKPLPAAVTVMTVLVLVAVLFSLVQMRCQKAHPSILKLQARLRTIINLVGFQPKFKQFISFYQILDRMSTVFELQMPEEMILLMDRLKVFRGDVSIIFPGTCIGTFLTRLRVQTMLPLVAILVATLVSEMSAAFGTRTAGFRMSQITKSAIAGALPLSLVISFAFVAPSSVAVLDSFTCVPFATGSMDDAAGGRRDLLEWFLKADLSVPCNGKHLPADSQITLLGTVMFFVWPIGLPLLYTALLVRSRTAIRARRPTRLSRACYFLHGEYKPQYYWWEVLDIIRRLALMGYLRFVTKSRPFNRLMSGIVISMFFLVLVLWLRPHRRDEDNLIAALVHLAIMLMLLIGCVVESYVQGVSSNVERAASLRMLGIDNLADLNEIVVAIPVATYCAIALVVLVLAASARMPRTFHDKHTDQIVHLSLQKTQKYHLFLSHIWGTGQDQVAAIKRQLCLLLPGVSIFLDVDDLEEISALERYIDETCVVLIFLSKGYFRSKNCLREVVESCKKQKPLVLVWEPDSAKGGAPIEALRAELYTRREMLASLGATPEECEAYVFNAPQTAMAAVGLREIVPWFRIADFQLKSLTMIAESMLNFTPAYAEHRETLKIYLPRQLDVARMSLPTPVNMYVSPLNPGADEAGRELAKALRGLIITDCPPAGGISPEFELPVWGENEPEPDHLLIYLTKKTFQGEVGARFAEQVRGIRKNNLPYLMIHERDPQRHSCEFGEFFQSTPQDLIDDGLFDPLAISFYHGPHRQVSYAIAAKALKAVEGVIIGGKRPSVVAALTEGFDKSANMVDSAKSTIRQTTATLRTTTSKQALVRSRTSSFSRGRPAVRARSKGSRTDGTAAAVGVASASSEASLHIDEEVGCTSAPLVELDAAASLKQQRKDRNLERARRATEKLPASSIEVVAANSSSSAELLRPSAGTQRKLHPLPQGYPPNEFPARASSDLPDPNMRI